MFLFQGPNSSSPTLPILSPALPRRPEGILPRRPAPSMQMDTTKSLSPLSVEIPPNHISSYSSSQRKGTSSISSSNQSTPTATKSSSKLAKPKIKESPSERSATGRKMRDCRKFIHYEFSPPFVSSESSVSEMDSPEQSRETFMKKLGRKKLRAERTQSMTDELLSPLVTSSSSSRVTSP